MSRLQTSGGFRLHSPWQPVQRSSKRASPLRMLERMDALTEQCLFGCGSYSVIPVPSRAVFLMVFPFSRTASMLRVLPDAVLRWVSGPSIRLAVNRLNSLRKSSSHFSRTDSSVFRLRQLRHPSLFPQVRWKSFVTRSMAGQLYPLAKALTTPPSGSSRWSPGQKSSISTELSMPSQARSFLRKAAVGNRLSLSYFLPFTQGEANPAQENILGRLSLSAFRRPASVICAAFDLSIEVFSSSVKFVQLSGYPLAELVWAKRRTECGEQEEIRFFISSSCRCSNARQLSLVWITAPSLPRIRQVASSCDSSSAMQLEKTRPSIAVSSSPTVEMFPNPSFFNLFLTEGALKSAVIILVSVSKRVIIRSSRWSSCPCEIRRVSLSPRDARQVGGMQGAREGSQLPKAGLSHHGSVNKYLPL